MSEQISLLFERAANRIAALKPLPKGREPEIPQHDWPSGPEDKDGLTRIEEKKRGRKTGTDIGLIDNSETESVETGTQNILAVYDEATPSEQDFWGRWYHHAHEDVKRLADKYGLPMPYVAAIVAVMSPGNKWAANLRAAEQALMLADKIMDDPRRLKIEQEREGTRHRMEQLAEEIKHLKGDRSNPDNKAKMDAVLQESKKLMRDLNDQEKQYSELARGLGITINSYPKNVRKAIKILEDEDINKWVSGPKVSAFLKALLDPASVDREMVLDSHAINIWLGVKRPIKETPSGIGERRKKLLESYRQAAEARGTNTRAVQAVTWYIWKMLSAE